MTTVIQMKSLEFDSDSNEILLISSLSSCDAFWLNVCKLVDAQCSLKLISPSAHAVERSFRAALSQHLHVSSNFHIEAIRRNDGSHFRSVLPREGLKRLVLTGLELNVV